jgi:hypothetical protein
VATKKIKLVRGDNYPQIRVELTDVNTGAPIDLTGASITLHFRAVGSSTVLFSRPGVVPVGTAAQGQGVFTFQSGDLNIDPGDYEGEVEVVWSGLGARQTVYDLLKFRVRQDFA